jgi:hypothetical protein
MTVSYAPVDLYRQMRSPRGSHQTCVLRPLPVVPLTIGERNMRAEPKPEEHFDK